MASSSSPPNGSAVTTTHQRMRPPWRTAAGARAGHGFPTPPAVTSRARERWRAQLHNAAAAVATQICRPGAARQLVPGPPHPPARPGRAPPVGDGQRGVACARHPRAPPSGRRCRRSPLSLRAAGGGRVGRVGAGGGGRRVAGGRPLERGQSCPLSFAWGRARVSFGLAAAPPRPLTVRGGAPLSALGGAVVLLSWRCGRGRRKGSCALAGMEGNAPRRPAPADHAPFRRGALQRRAQRLHCRSSSRHPCGLSCRPRHRRRL